MRGVLTFALLVAACGDDGGGPAARAYDALSYELRASYDFDGRTLHASEDVTLQLPAGATSAELDGDVAVKRVLSGGAEVRWQQDGAVLRVLDLAGPRVTFTVEYDAHASSSLAFSRGRDADPVTSRMVYTDSEPDRGLHWLVANHRPSDRATWAVELTVAADEDVIANGARVRDEMTAAGRVVRYQLDDPIPTYIMAFAAGQLEHSDRAAGRVPLAVWHRRGLVIDAEAQLDVVAAAMASFEALIGPYPWESYSVVLLPVYGGGMENATITFNTEESGEGLVSFNLNAHELAHQWFGDWVTVETFADLWIKEGMATLLASEAARAARDVEGKGRLFGSDFGFDPRDRIRDPSLSDGERYTSGPYERAAWLLTQIRARAGDQAFFAGLRRVLDEHALGTIDASGFLAALGAPDAARALEVTAVPALTFSGGTLALSDPDATMLVPLGVTVVDPAGSATPAQLAAGQSRALTVPAGGYLALDEGDVHPLETFSVADADRAALASLSVPTGAGAIAAFAARSPSHQERGLAAAGLPPGGAAAFPAFYQSLDSTFSRRSAEILGCRALRAGLDPGWPAALAPILRAPSLPSFTTAYAACGATFAAATFGAEIGALDASASARLQYLMGFDFGPQASFDALSPVARSSAQLELRDVAVARLGYQAFPGFGYQGVPAEQVPAWQAFFRDRLAEATSAARFNAVFRGIFGLRDESALPAVAAKLRALPLSAAQQQQVVCGVHTFASAPAFTAFGSALQPWSSLSAEARAALENPSTCP